LRNSNLKILFLLSILVVTTSSISVANLKAQDELITPDSEFVRKMVRPAINYLIGYRTKPERDFGSDALLGLAIYNGELRLGKEPYEIKQIPVLKEILNTVQGAVQDMSTDGERTIYAACVSGLLLAEVDSVKYAAEIEKVLTVLYNRQAPHGGWGYTKEPAGDVSQTQYASLFLWLAKNKDFQVKASAVEGAIKYLIGVQRGSGGFPYKGEPGKAGGNTADTHSLTAAGLGSLYLLGDAYGLHGGDDVKKKRAVDGLLPPSVSVFVAQDPKKKKGASPPRFINGFDAAKAKGDAWFRNRFTVNPAVWTYYYLYGFERYSSFKERADRIAANPSPFWYAEGAKFLKSKQDGNGSWMTENGAEKVRAHSTCFAILFLVRSTQLLIPESVGVMETGMQGLPEEGPISLRNGRIMNQTFNRDFGDVMAMIETGKDTDWRAFETTFDSLVLDSNKKSRAVQLVTLRKMVEHPNADARRVAVKSISKFRDFDNIKFLIYALSDPEPDVARMANDGLRFISRKFNSKKISDKPNKQEIEALTKYWTDWFMTVDPNGTLLETDDN